MSKWIVPLAASALLASTSPSRGEDFAPSAPATKLANRRFHDGFYLRTALGAGAFSSRDTVGDSTATQPTYAGGGGAIELSIGGALRPGLVLAGSALLQSAILGTFRDSAGATTVAHRHDFGLFGPTVDYFPDPSRGFHVLATIGGALMSDYRDDRVRKTWASRSGAGLSLGAGYDAWVSDNWSLGFLLRVTAASLAASEQADVDTVQAPQDTQRSIAAISLTFTTLYQ